MDRSVKKHLIPVFLAAVFLLPFCGCSFATMTFEKDSLVYDVQPFRFPVKFYLSGITTKNECLHKVEGIPLFREEELEKIRAAFAKYHPQLFTGDPDAGLKMTLVISFREWKNSAVFSSGLNALLSLGTVMLIPMSGYSTQEWQLEFLIGERKHSNHIRVATRENQAGWGTAALLPDIEDCYCESESFFGPWRVREERMKDFIQVLVNEIYSFPHDVIHEQYLKRKGKSTQLLE